MNLIIGHQISQLHG